jgi:hypothetical protein
VRPRQLLALIVMVGFSMGRFLTVGSSFAEQARL